MKKTQLYLSEKQVKKLNELAEEAGVSFAEMLRRALDASPMMKPVDPPGLDPRMGKGKKIISDLEPSSTPATGYERPIEKRSKK